jgi:hypothetical protein
VWLTWPKKSGKDNGNPKIKKVLKIWEICKRKFKFRKTRKKPTGNLEDLEKESEKPLPITPLCLLLLLLLVTNCLFI